MVDHVTYTVKKDMQCGSTLFRYREVIADARTSALSLSCSVSSKFSKTGLQTGEKRAVECALSVNTHGGVDQSVTEDSADAELGRLPPGGCA